MTNFEGSVHEDSVDDEVIETEDETTESEEDSVDENQQDIKTTEDASEDSDESKSSELTEKGTKKDSNPMSALNQELANHRSRVKEYESILSDPEQLEEYLKALKQERGTKEEKIDKQVDEETLVTDPDKIETKEDLKSYAKYLKKELEKRIEELTKSNESIKQGITEKSINEKISTEVDMVHAKYPFLRETNPDGTPNPNFDKDLEKEIAEQFHELDFDPKTKRYLGKTSLTKIVERTLRIKNLGESTGAKKAQTTTIDKRRGAIKSSVVAVNNASDESKLTPAQTIAKRIAQSAKRN